MAKTKETPQVDDLLGEETPVVNGTPSQADIDAINAEIEAAKIRIKELKAAAKGQKVKVNRELKGEMVTFTNKSGARITGLGVLYYVARMDGKLHYKEASQVTKMTEEEVAEYEATKKID